MDGSQCQPRGGAVIETTPVAHVPFLARLRVETRLEHDAIEAVLDLTGGGLTRDGYRLTLERFYGYYQPLEDAVRAVEGWAGHGFDPDERRKTSLLESDLRVIGVDAPDWLPVCRDLPRVDSVAAAFGCLYVTEGATLGGQVISRHVRQTLGVTPETGGRFFHGYGDRTGVMWQTFRTALAAFATTQDTQDQVAAAAVQTFRTLRAWCERREVA